MSEFTIIETQEQLDRVIGERIRRAEATAEAKAAEKYQDYSAVKTQNEELTKQIAQLTEQITKQTETIDSNKAIVDDLTAKVQGYETASVKTKIALELGLPYQMAERLNGADEQAIRKDAEAIVKLIGAQKPLAPLGSGESVGGGDSKKLAERKFVEWFDNYNNQ